MTEGPRPSPAVEAARDRLGLRRLALAIHDASLPGDPGDDIGRGAPASPAALRLAAFARATGFDVLQLGPQGLTDEDDASPYMGTLFSRNPLSICLARLADPAGEWGELLPASRLRALAAARPPGAETRVPYTTVFRAQRSALGAAFERFEKLRAAGDAAAVHRDERLAAFEVAARHWLESDAFYDALRTEYGGRDWPHWQGPRADLDRALGDASNGAESAEARRRELARRHAPALRFYRFVQLLAHEQHALFRAETRRLGLRLFGDLQIGVSPRDTWRHPRSFLARYRLGAPPSRTNPEGQPWDYPVLDPDGYAAPDGSPGPALRFLVERLEKLFDEFDAIRIDHPQGLVCPWVYRSGPDALGSVQRGARLFSSPAVPEHPDLAPYAIAWAEQLASDPATPRYDDHWVKELEPQQVERYALLFDRVVEVARRSGEEEPTLLCEVLSTLPYPLERVLARHGLGRFRVTQKADPARPDDVYRAENAAPTDWVMFGNHDTQPLWRVLGEWEADGRLEARAAHAALRLEASPDSREALRARLCREPGLLAHAEMALVFASPAENASVFFADWLGVEEVYNHPGTVGSENWSLRLPFVWREEYEDRLRRDRALNLPLALWLALRARPDPPRDLLRALRDEAEGPRVGAPLPA